MLTRKEIEAGLPQFTGTEHYYRHQPGVLLTDGAKWLAESAECYWLYDIVWSVKPILDKRWFAAVRLTVKDNQGEVTIDDGNDNVLYTQHIDYTDFPLPKIKLFVAGSEEGEVIMLPSEY